MSKIVETVVGISFMAFAIGILAYLLVAFIRATWPVMTAGCG